LRGGAYQYLVFSPKHQIYPQTPTTDLPDARFVRPDANNNTSDPHPDAHETPPTNARTAPQEPNAAKGPASLDMMTRPLLLILLAHNAAASSLADITQALAQGLTHGGFTFMGFRSVKLAWDETNAILREASVGPAWDETNAILREASVGPAWDETNAILLEASVGPAWDETNAILLEASVGRAWNETNAILREASVGRAWNETNAILKSHVKVLEGLPGALAGAAEALVLRCAVFCMIFWCLCFAACAACWCAPAQGQWSLRVRTLLTLHPPSACMCRIFYRRATHGGGGNPYVVEEEEEDAEGQGGQARGDGKGGGGACTRTRMA
jgi:hypothetical protein